ncbi:hypothetical protein [Kutzneria sp. 744]|uniref:hypothetical protein n=1 Tax=Kutzneria sp. (strain 744) TaxID=345341 RepID=UPI0012F75C34|nr:hypothetical protein [Kutzneria sp. 744]
MFDDPTPVGQMLLQQHLPTRPGEHAVDDPPDYVAALTDRVLHPLAVLRLLDCYEYQTTRTLGWATSTSGARAWTARLRETILNTLPAEAKAEVRHGANYVAAYTLLDAYTGTPWGISSLDQVPDIGDGVIHIPIVRKGLRVEILTGPVHCSNNGLSSRVRHVTILGIGQERTLPAFAQISEPSDTAPGAYLLFECGRFVARPADAPPGKHFMASGAHLYCHDDRWSELVGHCLPIPLHDRTEP